MKTVSTSVDAILKESKRKWRKLLAMHIVFVALVLIMVIVFFVGLITEDIIGGVIAISIIIYIGVVLFIEKDSLKEACNNANPKAFGMVYRANVYSINKGIKVEPNKSYGTNIANADKDVVAEIFVQETTNPNLCMEISTGLLIPLVYKEDASIFHSKTYWQNCYTVYVKKYKKYKTYCPYEGVSGLLSTYFEHDITRAACPSLEEVQLYIKNCQDDYKRFSSFEEYLKNIFEKGNQYYSAAAMKNDVARIGEYMNKVIHALESTKN